MLTLHTALFLLICSVCDLEQVIYKYLSETQFSHLEKVAES